MGIKAFVRKATVGFSPADCRIKIPEIAGMCDALISGLVEMRVWHARSTLNEFVDFPKFKAEAAGALEKNLLGVCPKCHTVTKGEQLLQVYDFRERMRTEVGPVAIDQPIAIAIASRILAELSGGVERLLKGRCRNSSCNCERILVFWRAHESKKLTKRLAKMGIEI